MRAIIAAIFALGLLASIVPSVQAAYPEDCGDAVDDALAFERCTVACLPEIIEQGLFDKIFDGAPVDQVPQC